MSTVLEHNRAISLTHSRPSIRILAALNELHAQLVDLRDGEVATYIPELARTDPDLFGITVVTCEGEVFSVGDSGVDFTLQSIANPFVYGFALDQLGRKRIEDAVGVEPTGNPFHAVVLERGTNRPMNPLVNAGAIAITSLLSGSDPTDRLNRILDALSVHIGGKPSVDMGVFMSERTTADRNRAIAHLMRNFGRLEGNLDEVLDLYFQICSTCVNTVQLIARFDAERQALAIMDHPNIAKIHDAGATDLGRPYFVMELCAGEPIATYCDKNRLGIDERLDLFTQVCQAVQHAHTKGVIHRDIKPSNVLVSTQDGRPLAKVIDFGIAKAVENRLTERTLFTEHHQLIGTPEYMSPEQAAGSLDIDTRTDIYSLGVLLYELLTGSTPFSGKTLRAAAFAEIQRIIREVDPPKPSTRLSQSADSLASVAATRGIEPGRLGALVRGELDWVVMKSLEKDRARRYESAGAFAEDVRRYLAGDAVAAAPPSRSYRFRKFLRRHRGIVAAASAVGCALLIGAIGFAWQAQVARVERDRAVEAEAETKQRADELQQVSDFQAQMLAQVDAAAAGLRLTADVRDRLDAALQHDGMTEEERAAQMTAFSAAWGKLNTTDVALELIKSTIFQPALAAIDRRFENQPKVDAALRGAISSRYLDLGLYDDSWSVTEQVLKVLHEIEGEDHPETLAAVLGKCKLLNLMGRHTEAEAILRSMIEKEEPRFGADHPLVLRMCDFLGESLCGQGRFAEADTPMRDSLARRRRVLGDDHEETLASIGSYSIVLRGLGRPAEAVPLALEALERRRRVLGDDHPYTLGSYNSLAVLYLDLGQLAEAEAAFRQAVEGRRHMLGEVHPDTLQATGNLISVLARRNKHVEAESVQRELLEQMRRILGPDHPESMIALSNLASYLISAGRLAEAEPLCREAIERQVRVSGMNNPRTLISYNVMSYLLRRQGKDVEAEPYLRQAVELSVTVLGEDHPDRMVFLINMGRLTGDLGKQEECDRYLREAIERCERALGAEHPYTRAAVQDFGRVLIKTQRFIDAIQLLSRFEPAWRASAEATADGSVRVLLLRLGRARTAVGEYAAAERNLLEAHREFVNASGPTARGSRDSAEALVDLYTAWHAVEPTGDYDRKAAEWATWLAEPPEQARNAREDDPASA